MNPSGSQRLWLSRLEKGLVVVAALLTVVVLAALWEWWGNASDAQNLVDSVRVAKPVSQPEDAVDPPNDSNTSPPARPSRPTRGRAQPNAATSIHDELATKITKRNMFMFKQNPTLTGVLGDKAYFSDGQSAGAGGSISMGKVLQIGPDWAEVEVEGKAQKMYVFGPPRPSAPAPETPAPKTPKVASPATPPSVKGVNSAAPSPTTSAKPNDKQASQAKTPPRSLPTPVTGKLETTQTLDNDQVITPTSIDLAPTPKK